MDDVLGVQVGHGLGDLLEIRPGLVLGDGVVAGQLSQRFALEVLGDDMISFLCLECLVTG